MQQVRAKIDSNHHSHHHHDRYHKALAIHPHQLRDRYCYTPSSLRCPVFLLYHPTVGDDGGGLWVKEMGVLAMSMSAFCYARIMVDMVDAVSGFKMFSEFTSLGGRFRQFLVLDHRPIECVCGADFMALDFCLAGLSPWSRASLFSVYLHRPASIILPPSSSAFPCKSSRPFLCIKFNFC